MSDENSPLTLNEAISEFFGIPDADLPGNLQAQNRAIVAEVIRIALTSRTADEDGWRTLHIHSLRNWMVRKLRALIPDIETNSSEEDIFLQTLKDGPGGNLVFLGDVIQLASGYYSPAPTRVVPIHQNLCLLVSGLPTAVFSRSGIEVTIFGISRGIRDGAAKVNMEIGIPIQDTESYAGLTVNDELNETSLGELLASERRISWMQAGDWLCYQGNRGRYGFDYTDYYYSVSSPVGIVSLWRTSQDFGHVEHWLRVKDQGRDQMVRVQSHLWKHYCLLLDSWSDNPRKIMFRNEEEGETVLQANFAPPAAQTRWVHALGGRWLGSRRGWIRWALPSDAAHSAAEIFRVLPVTIEQVEAA